MDVIEQPPTQPFDATRSDDDAAGDGPALTDRLAACIDRYVWHRNGPHDAAVRVLADQQLRDALRAADVVAELDARHQPVRWAASSDVVVCSCGHGAYDHCPDGLILRGET